MFDLSFAEILLVVIVAVIFIGPNELPVVIRTVAKFMRSMRSLARELRDVFDDLSRESGVKDAADDFHQEIRMIKGDDGKMYEAYDASHVMTARKPHKAEVDETHDA
jgi:Tat protein translocase TatB subunit